MSTQGFFEDISNGKLNVGNVILWNSEDLGPVEHELACYFELLDTTRWFPRDTKELSLFVDVLAFNQHFPCDRGNLLTAVFRKTNPTLDVGSLHNFDGWERLANRTGMYVERWSDLEHWLRKPLPEKKKKLLCRAEIIEEAIYFVRRCITKLNKMLNISTGHSVTNAVEPYITMARDSLKRFYISSEMMRNNTEILRLVEICLQLFRKGCIASYHPYALLGLLMKQGMISFPHESGGLYTYVHGRYILDMVLNSGGANVEQMINELDTLVYLWRKTADAMWPVYLYRHLQPAIDACNSEVQ